jgi:hypothetical protein
LHAHVNEPIVFVHDALPLQLCVFSVHSLTLAQDTPVPLNPATHSHVKLPTVFVHVAFLWQLSVWSVHSLFSVQSTPLPR